MEDEVLPEVMVNVSPGPVRSKAKSESDTPSCLSSNITPPEDVNNTHFWSKFRSKYQFEPDVVSSSHFASVVLSGGGRLIHRTPHA